LENQNERDNLENPAIDGMITKTSQEQDGRYVQISI
jgi:hypothetical protein